VRILEIEQIKEISPLKQYVMMIRDDDRSYVMIIRDDDTAETIHRLSSDTKQRKPVNWLE
jgi:hypothetical protein